jgi:hypothetical protein
MKVALYECGECGYRGPAVVAYSKVPANRFRAVFFLAIALRFIPVLGAISRQLLSTARESCPGCGEHIMLKHWAGPVEPAEMELFQLRQKQEDLFKRESDKLVVPILGAVMVVIICLLIWQLT